MNKLAKKAERQVWAKQKTNISDFLKKKRKETEIRDKQKHGEEAK